jgi:hypothetical protein
MEIAPMKMSPDCIIAERSLVFRDGSTESREVRILLAKPESHGKTEYSCQVQIVGLGDEKVRTIYGVDSIHAMQLALKFASQMLENYRHELSWLGNEDIGV